jgi:hypothetical protein
MAPAFDRVSAVVAAVPLLPKVPGVTAACAAVAEHMTIADASTANLIIGSSSVDPAGSERSVLQPVAVPLQRSNAGLMTFVASVICASM